MIEEIELEKIQDNPYQCRTTYPRNAISDLAASIKTNGLLQAPVGRKVNSHVELVTGHLRKRAFLQLQKKDPKKWGTMPVDIREVSNTEMAILSLEENIKRRDITPIEIARGIDGYLKAFPKKTETDLAKELNMTQAAISNMRRVLTLPDKLLEKIDQDIINFTMGRELLVLVKCPSAEKLMLEAVKGLKFGNKTMGEPCTVEGIQKAIHTAVQYNLKPITAYSYSSHPDFDTKLCDKCEKVITTHPMKTQSATWCTDSKCWDKKQEQHRKEKAKAAAKLAEEAINKQLEEEKQKPRLISQEILPPPGVRFAEEVPDAECKSCKLDTKDHTIGFSFPDGKGGERKVCIKDYQAIVQTLPPEQPKVKAGKGSEFIHALHTNDAAQVQELLEEQTEPEHLQPAANDKEPAPPQAVKDLAKEKAGTRAIILDMKEIRSGNYGDLKEGHVTLKGRYDNLLDKMDDPTECTERCTQGFHYAYDSSDRHSYYADDKPQAEVLFICTNPKCATQKKAAFTRARNAEGQARKKAEMKVQKQAVEDTKTLDMGRMKLIILAQLSGYHVGHSYYGGGSERKEPLNWWYDKLSAGIEKDQRKVDQLFKLLAKESPEHVAQLIVEFMLYSLSYVGDPQRYKMMTEEPLKWMGYQIEEVK